MKITQNPTAGGSKNNLVSNQNSDSGPSYPEASGTSSGLSNANSVQFFCDHCRGIDIQQSYRKIAKHKDGYILADLGNLLELSTSPCPLCQFWLMVARQNGILEAYRGSPDRNIGNFQLRMITLQNLYFSAEYDKSFLSQLEKQLVFCLVPGHYSNGDDSDDNLDDYMFGDDDTDDNDSTDDDNDGIDDDNDGKDDDNDDDDDDTDDSVDNSRDDKVDRDEWLRIGVISQETSHMHPSQRPTRDRGKKTLITQVRRVVPDHIPYNLLTKWIDKCMHGHGSSCEFHPPTDAPCLRVIDCNTLEIVKPPQKCEYLALRYVWGGTQARGPGPMKSVGSSVVWKMPQQMALVVTDSIQVTLKLGYRFLWIDKYCIDQDNISEKTSQIADIDQVYQRCVVVIVAGGGMDSSFGLPGVSRRLRLPQPSITLQGSTWVSRPPHPAHCIRQSGWITRGWTFQEAIFSKRRIYFTEHQVAFECEEATYTEAFEKPGDPITTQPWYPEFVLEPALMAWPQLLGLSSISPQIEEYSSRALSTDLDALNAFRSFYTNLKRKNRPIHEFFGLPIVRHEREGWEGCDSDHTSDDNNDIDSDNNSDNGETSSSTKIDEERNCNEENANDESDKTEADKTTSADYDGLELIATEIDAVNSLTVALCWYHDKHSPRANIRRRPMFPSWSWLGWTGKVSYEYSSDLYSESPPSHGPSDNNQETRSSNPKIEIHVEDKERKLWPWRTWQDVENIVSLYKNDQLTGRLRIKSHFVDLAPRSRFGTMVVDRQGYKRGAEVLLSHQSLTTDPSGQDTGSAADVGPGLEMQRFLSLGQVMLMVREESEGVYTRSGVVIPEKLRRKDSWEDVLSDDSTDQDLDGQTMDNGRTKLEPVQLWLI